MKVGCCSSRCLALLLLVLLEAVTLVFPQQQRCEDLTNTCSMLAISNLGVVATGMEISTPMCSIIVPMETGDVIDWYFTRTTTESATRIVIDGSKYSVDGELSQILIVNNVSLNDEGYYFCQLRRNGQLTPQQGSCLRVLAPAMFQTCSGDNVPQRGCSNTELLTATIGEPVDFNIVLVHSGRNESCNNQFIQMISLFKISAMTTLTDCSNFNCSYNVSLMERLKISRTQNEFDIIVTLNNLTEADNGYYSAVADVRIPPNSRRMCMYKNFTLTISEMTHTEPISGQETTIIPTSAHTEPISDQEIIIILTLVLLFIIVAIIILIVCICSICYYHYRKKTRLGQRLRRVSKGGPASNIYDVPTEIYDAQLIPDDREVTIAHPNHETKMLMQENSAYGTKIAIAPEIANIAYEHTSRSDSGEKEIGHAVNEYGLKSKTDDSTSTTMYSEISPCPTTCQGPQ